MKNTNNTRERQGSGNYFKNEKPKTIKIPRPVENIKTNPNSELRKTILIVFKPKSIKKLARYILVNNFMTKTLQKGWKAVSGHVSFAKKQISKADNSLARFTENMFSFEEQG
jgi:hypothetical protein